VTDAVTRYRGVPAAAVLAFGGVALLAGGCVVALVVTDRWRDDSTAVAVVFWALVVVGIVLAVGLVRAAVQIVRPPIVLRLDSTGYRVSRRSGATGVRRADWRSVERVRTEQRDGRDRVVIQLTTGATTEIPASALATPRTEWLGDLDARLNKAHGQRRLT
jgi:MFS family permease